MKLCDTGFKAGLLQATSTLNRLSSSVVPAIRLVIAHAVDGGEWPSEESGSRPTRDLHRVRFVQLGRGRRDAFFRRPAPACHSPLLGRSTSELFPH
jgi:hypothetical protein